METIGRPLGELLSLAGGAAIVTGAGHGVGLAVAKRLAEAGAAFVPQRPRWGAGRDECGSLSGAGGDALAVAGVVLVNDAGIWPRELF